MEGSGSGSVQLNSESGSRRPKNIQIRNTDCWHRRVYRFCTHLLFFFFSVQEIGVQVDGAALVPQAAAVLSAYEAHFSQEYGQQRVQGINLAKVSSERKQGCGSVFI
jgi:hypothetical protein